MKRVALLALLLVVGSIHTAQAGGIIDPAELLDRIIVLETDVRTLQSDLRGVAPRLDEADQRIAALDSRIENDFDKAQETANRLSSEVARNNVQAGRLDGHDARLDLVPSLVRCMLPPLAYRHVTVRTAKGRTISALVPVKDAPLGFKPGLYWLARINAQCAKGLK